MRQQPRCDVAIAVQLGHRARRTPASAVYIRATIDQFLGQPGLVAIARRLIAFGANPNLRFPWRHHEVERPVLWGAVFVVRSVPLAIVLLDAGGNPSDGVTLPLAASAGNVAVLDLLLAYGADVNRPWATDGSSPLYAILHAPSRVGRRARSQARGVRRGAARRFRRRRQPAPRGSSCAQCPHATQTGALRDRLDRRSPLR
jgi:hypothetical protein